MSNIDFCRAAKIVLESVMGDCEPRPRESLFFFQESSYPNWCFPSLLSSSVIRLHQISFLYQLYHGCFRLSSRPLFGIMEHLPNRNEGLRFQLARDMPLNISSMEQSKKIDQKFGFRQRQSVYIHHGLLPRNTST